MDTSWLYWFYVRFWLFKRLFLFLFMVRVLLGVNWLLCFWFLYRKNSASWFVRSGGFNNGFPIWFKKAMFLWRNFLSLFLPSFLDFLDWLIWLRHDNWRFFNRILFATVLFTDSTVVFMTVRLIWFHLTLMLWKFALVDQFRAFLGFLFVQILLSI